MNYYPNYYPYSNPIQQQQQQTIPALNGKVVDSIDTARVSDVPIGSYGIFPKADLGEIYIKTWTPNGTTNIITYSPTGIKEQKAEKENVLLEKINAIEAKLDLFLKTSSDNSKEVKSSGY